MNMLQAEEVLDLNLMMGLTPICEDDHESEDVWLKPPACAVIAVARMVYTKCGGEVVLICQPMVDWATADPPAMCLDCGPGCLKIIDF